MEKHWIFWPFSKGEEVSESRKKFVWIFNLKECQHKYILILSLPLNGELKAGKKQEVCMQGASNPPTTLNRHDHLPSPHTMQHKIYLLF